jgi:hypothetical protein
VVPISPESQRAEPPSNSRGCPAASAGPVPDRSRAQAADCYSGPSRFSSTLMIVIALIGPPPGGPHGATPIGD